jgi:hypothetical protein
VIADLAQQKAVLVDPDQTYTSVVYELTPLALIVITHAICVSTYSWNRMTAERLVGVMSLVRFLSSWPDQRQLYFGANYYSLEVVTP